MRKSTKVLLIILAVSILAFVATFVTSKIIHNRNSKNLGAETFLFTGKIVNVDKDANRIDCFVITGQNKAVKWSGRTEALYFDDKTDFTDSKNAKIKPENLAKDNLVNVSGYIEKTDWPIMVSLKILSATEATK